MPYLISAVLDYHVLVNDKREASQCVTVQPRICVVSQHISSSAL